VPSGVEAATLFVQFSSSPANIANGGFVFIHPGATYNGAFTSFNGGSAINGGAVFVNAGAVFTCNNCRFVDNTATNGGAILNNVGGSVSITASTFSGNSATNGDDCYGTQCTSEGGRPEDTERSLPLMSVVLVLAMMPLIVLGAVAKIRIKRAARERRRAQMTPSQGVAMARAVPMAQAVPVAQAMPVSSLA
jgi:hypothetical protein